VLGQPMPASKKDDALPYTYEARVDRFRGAASDPLEWSFLSDTLCGLVRTMIDEGYEPTEVRIFGAYGGDVVELEIDACMDDDGWWLTPPELCHQLEERYRETMDERYRGHVEHGRCAFDDRDQDGKGPY